MDPARDLERLAARLDETAAVLDWPDERLYPRIEDVSAWSPAQHVDHILRALDVLWGRAEMLAEGVADEIRAKGAPRVLGRLVLLTGWIPRGRGRAPETVLPDPRPVRHRLRVALGEATRRSEVLRRRADRLGEAPGVLPHPQLGDFDARRWIRFSDVHTRHHLAIVADIDRRRAVGEVEPRPLPEAQLGDEPEYGVSAESP